MKIIALAQTLARWRASCPAAERMGMAGKRGDLMRFVDARNALGMLSERLGTDRLF